MDVYVKQITGSTFHDYFYTNAEVIVSALHDVILPYILLTEP